MAEIKLTRRVKYAGDIANELIKAGWDFDTAVLFVNNLPDAKDRVEVVRCKKCEFGELSSTHRCKTQDGNTAEMSLYECLVNRSQRSWHAGTHFCSYGKPKKETREPVPCSECKHRMWADHYAECSKGHKGIVRPDDTCPYGERRTDG